MKLFSSSALAMLLAMLFSLGACAQNTAAPAPAVSAEAKPAEAKPAAESKPSLDKAWWLRIKIAELKSYPVANPPKSISKTTYDGKTAYYITASCCDKPSELYDEEGKLICFPSGGIAGGDGRCKSFILGASPIAVVWSDDRKPNQTKLTPVTLQEYTK